MVWIGKVTAADIFLNFAEFANRHAKELAVFIAYLRVPDSDNSDILQEVLLGAWRGRHGFTGQGSLRAWLFGIARRQALQFHRARKPEMRWNRPPAGATVDTFLNVEDGARPIEAHAADRDAVGGAVATLPIDLREAVVLAFVVGMPLAEVAQVQGVPLGTVKSRLHTARQRLKAALADAYPERASGHGVRGRLPDGAGAG